MSRAAGGALTVGIVSDTHDYLDPQLPELLRGSDLVLHAGDVTREPIVAALERIAPVRTARGNNDLGPFGESLPELLWIELGALTALVVHELGARTRFAPRVARAISRRPADIVVHGHSHRPAVSIEDGRLVVNPGSAGRRRFSLPRTAARMLVRGRSVEVTLYDLATSPPAPTSEPFVARL
ncbi:MAG TPA: metallophosphoesterase family protein [Anaeromyxobacteraceae bacterium]|nr:metallophosphoesterase family protein [Anaeromyxobacteraceae bacterium]